MLIEFTAESRWPARNAPSAKSAFRTAWASSKEPSTARAWTFAAPVQAIWRSCSGEILPSGYRMKMAVPFFPLRPWIAAAPVSPDVAPSTLIVSPRIAHCLA